MNELTATGRRINSGSLPCPWRRSRACWSHPPGTGAPCRQTGRVRDAPARPWQRENVCASAVAMARAYSGAATSSCPPGARHQRQGGWPYIRSSPDRSRPGRKTVPRVPQASGDTRRAALLRPYSVGINGRDDAPSSAGSELWPPPFTAALTLPRASLFLPRHDSARGGEKIQISNRPPMI